MSQEEGLELCYISPVRRLVASYYIIQILYDLCLNMLLKLPLPSSVSGFCPETEIEILKFDKEMKTHLSRRNVRKQNYFEGIFCSKKN